MEPMEIDEDNVQTYRPRRRTDYGILAFHLGLVALLVLPLILSIALNYHPLQSCRAAKTFTIQANVTMDLQDKMEPEDPLTENKQLNLDLDDLTKEIGRLLTENKQLKRLLTEYKTERDRLMTQMCPAGWIKFNGSCYLVSDRVAPWWEAREDCRRHGSELVVLDSDLEQSFLTLLIDDHAWVGLTETGHDGTFDDSPLNQTTWVKGQWADGETCPVMEETVDCVFLYKEGPNGPGFLEKVSCGMSLLWICEKSLSE